jgi:hypothetical protein
MDYRNCPYCDEVIGHGQCCDRMRKNVAEPIPFARFFERPADESIPPRRRRPRKATSAEDPRFDDVVRRIEDATADELP